MVYLSIKVFDKRYKEFERGNTRIFISWLSGYKKNFLDHIECHLNIGILILVVSAVESDRVSWYEV